VVQVCDDEPAALLLRERQRELAARDVVCVDGVLANDVGEAVIDAVVEGAKVKRAAAGSGVAFLSRCAAGAGRARVRHDGAVVREQRGERLCIVHLPCGCIVGEDTLEFGRQRRAAGWRRRGAGGGRQAGRDDNRAHHSPPAYILTSW
jgi:hypothetical protein